MAFFPSLAMPQVVKPIIETKLVSDDLEILITKYPADGKNLLIWLAPSFGFRKGHNDMAQLLSQRGFEIWRADINEALFMPHNSSSMRELNPKYVSDLITAAYTETHKKIVLISGSYGAIPALRGSREWLLTKPDNKYLLGIVLFSPNVYHSIPPLGTEPQYLPIAFSTNVPVAIFQGDKNGNRWQVDKLADALRSGGSAVRVEIMSNIVGLFYKEERNAYIENYFKQITGDMQNLIDWFNQQSYTLSAKSISEPKASVGSGLDSHLKPFKGNPRPHQLHMKDINDKSYKIDNFKGKVTIVNFWASWCTPCIKEIPSLNNLRQFMKGKPFELISINYAESVETIKEFMKMVDVEFPVLLDEQGTESAKWKVIAFPSTFVIGRDGLIHYGINAGIEWDKPEVLQLLENMLQQ